QPHCPNPWVIGHNFRPLLTPGPQRLPAADQADGGLLRSHAFGEKNQSSPNHPACFPPRVWPKQPESQAVGGAPQTAKPGNGWPLVFPTANPKAFPHGTCSALIVW